MATRTRDQRQQYVQTVLRGQERSPTAPTSLADEGSATNSPSPESPKETQTRSARQRAAGRQPGLWQEHKKAIIGTIIGAVGTIVTGLLIWMVSTTLIGLNREVGQLQEGAKATSNKLEDMQKNAHRFEDRIDKDIRWLRDRIEEIMRGRGTGRPREQGSK